MNDKIRVLLAEDEESIGEMIKLNLDLEGYHITWVKSGLEAFEQLKEAHFDLLISDVMMPQMDGWQLAEKLKLSNYNIPILFLTARNTSQDRIQGLTLGDDHLAKPFELKELLLRVSNLVKRTLNKSVDEDGFNKEISFGGNILSPLRFDYTNFKGEKGKLSKKEMELIKLLFYKANQVVSREEILNTVWGYDVYPSSRTIDNFILHFRKVFEEDPKSPEFFVSVRGVGYMFQQK